jgi:anti-anti-sigma factor
MPPQNQFGFSLQAYKLKDELFVKCIGWLRLHNCEDAKCQIQALTVSSVGKVYLHLGELNEVDSAGLGVIVGLHMTARKNKIDFTILSPTAGQMRLLETTRLKSILKIVSGVESETIRNRLEQPELRIALPGETQT